jgi:hypothetical protein
MHTVDASQQQQAKVNKHKIRDSKEHLAPKRKRRAAESTLMLYCIFNTSRKVICLPFDFPREESSPMAAQGMASRIRPMRIDNANVRETDTVAAPRK